MAARKKAASEAPKLLEDAGDGVEREETPTYGPYELVAELDGEPVNALTFGADPVVTLLPGEQFWTSELGLAVSLDEHPLVRKGSSR